MIKIIVERLSDETNMPRGIHPEKWEFLFDDIKDRTHYIRQFVTLEMVRKAVQVSLNGETIKDRFKNPDRAMTFQDWDRLG